MITQHDFNDVYHVVSMHGVQIANPYSMYIYMHRLQFGNREDRLLSGWNPKKYCWTITKFTRKHQRIWCVSVKDAPAARMTQSEIPKFSGDKEQYIRDILYLKMKYGF